MLSIITAIAQNGVIGIENRLPWHLPADLKHFKALTLGKPIIMGRKTYQSIGKPLPGRRNIVVSRNPQFNVQGCEVVGSLDEALVLTSAEAEVMVIGGAQLIAQALPKATRLYLTFIHQDFVGDCFFPEWDRGQWEEISDVEHLPDNNNPYSFSFVTLQRTLNN
jgi:dihydrofolate reductase